MSRRARQSTSGADGPGAAGPRPSPGDRGRPDRAALAAWACAILLGGGNHPFTRVTLLELDPLWSATLRLLIAGILLVALTRLLRLRIGSRASLLGGGALGAVGFAASPALVYWGLQETPAGTAQMLGALTPLVTLGMAVAVGLERLRWRSVVGALVALCGTGVVVADQMSADVPFVSLGAVLLGAVCGAAIPVLVKLIPQFHPVVSNAIGVLVGGVLLGVLSHLLDEQWVVPSHGRTWGALAFLIFGGTIGSYGLYFVAIRRWSASRASYAFLILPLVAAVYGAILLGETITPGFVVGGAIVLAGVWLGALAPDRRVADD